MSGPATNGDATRIGGETGLAALPNRTTHIVGWGHEVPKVVVTNADLEQIVETSDEWISTRTGIRERHIAGDGETTASMGAIAAARALAVAGVSADSVDLIVVATLTPDHPMPSTAVLVKEAIGSHRAAAFDLSAACSGFAYAYAVAHGFLTAGLGQRALVIGAESLSRVVDWSDRSTCVLFGDGAGAIVLDALDLHDDQNIATRPGTLSFELSADPSGAFALWIPGGSGDDADPLIKMDGAKTYVYATRTMAAVATAAIERAGLTVPEVDLVIPHQANLRIIEHVSKAIDFPMEKIFVNLDRYGNTSAASIPIALSEAVAAGRLKPGDVFCTVAFGGGYTSGAFVTRWDADPANGSRAASVDTAAIKIKRPEGGAKAAVVPAALKVLLDAKRR
ncbi:MAG: ketoacyl-ACP synthase III [Candidatus Aquidulcis sp.]|nr:MAG: ketoacyl-ACP synthase III [Candidatus Aquidulcis sp.]